MDTKFHWFAMRATYKREMVVKEYLERKGIEVFVPMRSEVKVVRGIKRKVNVPAITNLIFVYTQKDVLQQVKFGVEFLQYLTRKLDGNNIPIIVPSEQMELFRKVVEDDTIDKKFFAPGEVNLVAGSKVKVHGGVLDGYEGILVKMPRRRNKQFFLEMEGVVLVNPELTNYQLLEVVK